MSRTRRNFLTLTAAGVASLGTAGTAEAAQRITPLRVTTCVGTFEAVAAGPRNGRKVLLLHGFPELGREWDEQLRALAAAGYRAVAPDMRGYSPGVRPPEVEDYWLDYGVNDVVAIADALGWRKFDLVGHDWGAAVAWIAAARYAHRVRTLTAVSVPHLGAFAEALRVDPAQREASKYVDGFRRPTPIPETEILNSGKLTLRGVPQHKCDIYYERLSEPGALTAALNWYRANDFTGYEQRVALPTLFIASTEDPFVAPYGVQRTHDWVTGPYRLEVLDGIGHNVPEEAAETTSALLLSHLERF
ncbi:alpha/beta fold hydrolase [Kibdelosporangium persicum]|uniref:Pimeloyl-ACP methyl ester carboxylesterase n=1 Tax=Kibdelosporangium persicum TaxID=2698649 RepID=A0ABX2FFV2_9PSEU|nr:alpha/beta hydrolase [Kibdelosporangium persicum]NRN70255.1 Pimeloyl-ACP methyl ester carboxylesterase [Kibdelosporangium persicum]